MKCQYDPYSRGPPACCDNQTTTQDAVTLPYDTSMLYYIFTWRSSNLTIPTLILLTLTT